MGFFLSSRPTGSAAPLEPVPGWLERLPREALALFLGGMGVTVLVSLFAYSPERPGWSSSGLATATQGAGAGLPGVDAGLDAMPENGALGSFLSDLVLSFIGYVAFVVPLALFWLAWRLLKPARGQEVLPAGLRMVAAVVAVLAAAGLAALHVARAP